MVGLHEMAGVSAPMAAATSSVEEPLRWLIHGGPGTGKSHALKQIRELFTDVLHWDIGVQYQIVASRQSWQNTSEAILSTMHVAYPSSNAETQRTTALSDKWM